MSESIASLLKDKGLSSELLEQLPTRWERLGDIYVLPVSSFKDPAWNSIGDEFWPMVAKSLGAQRLARHGRVALTGTRDSTLEILVGDNGWVEHRENGIVYSFDTTKCMFSWGNLSEKLRTIHLDCKDEVIVDLFAGIEYFVLPAALVRSLNITRLVQKNYTPGPQECNVPCMNRVGKISQSLVTINQKARTRKLSCWSFMLCATIVGYLWDISIDHTDRVKWYAPHIRHIVVDIRSKQTKIAAS